MSFLFVIFSFTSAYASDVASGKVERNVVSPSQQVCGQGWKEFNKSAFRTSRALIEQDGKGGFIVRDRDTRGKLKAFVAPEGSKGHVEVSAGDWLQFNSDSGKILYNWKTGKRLKLSVAESAGLSAFSYDDDRHIGWQQQKEDGSDYVLILAEQGSDAIRKLKGRGDYIPMKDGYAFAEKSGDGQIKVRVGRLSSGREETLKLSGDTERISTMVPGSIRTEQNAAIDTGHGWRVIQTGKLKIVSGVFPEERKFLVMKREPKDPKRPPGTFSRSLCNLKTEVVNMDSFEVEREEDKLIAYNDKSKVLHVGILGEDDAGESQIFTGDEVNNYLAGRPAKPIISGYKIVVSDPPIWALRSRTFDGPQELVNLEDGRVVKNVPVGTIGDMKVSADGKRLLVEDDAQYTSAWIVDTTTEKVQAIPRPNSGSYYLSKNFTELIKRDEDEDGKWIHTERVCIRVPVRVVSNDCNCWFGPGAKLEVSDPLIYEADAYDMEKVCREKYWNWEAIAPDIKSGTISEKMAERYLMRFSRKGEYDPARHESLLLGILQSKLVDQANPHADYALQNIAMSHPLSYDKLFRLANLEKRLKRVPSDVQACRTSKESEEIKKRLVARLPKEKDGYEPKTMDSYFWMRPFWREISNLDPKIKKDMIETVGENLARAAGTDPQLSGLMHSKLYYFSKKAAMELANEVPKVGTDLSFIINSGEVAPVILGSQPINGKDMPNSELFPSSNLKYGFHYRPLEKVVKPSDAEAGSRKFWTKQWKHNDQTFRAEASIKFLGDISENVLSSSRPPYESWEKSGQIEGVIVNAPGMSSQSNERYKLVYEKMGFTFGEPRRVNTVEFISDAVKTGKAAYLYKNAHSDADERNLARVPVKSELLQGERILPSGVKERISILGATEGDGHDAHFISNQEMGDWVRMRAGAAPLLYINSSCNSESKTRAELAAAHSKKLEVIASRTEMDGFIPTAEDVSVILFKGLHERKSYEQIRADLVTNPKYAKNQSNVWAFPDEPEYDSGIRKRLRQAIDVQVVLKGPNGERIQPSDLVDHECVGTSCKPKVRNQ